MMAQNKILLYSNLDSGSPKIIGTQLRKTQAGKVKLKILRKAI
jgi:hypothetical protein